MLSLLGPGRAHAQGDTCPEKPAEEPLARRNDAKRFFDLAQASQAAGNNNEALKQYVCSFKMVRHPFTAYNLAKLAQKTGDLELALSSYKAYLELAPDADDRPQVKREIETLQERIDQLNRDQNIQLVEKGNVVGDKTDGAVTPVGPVTNPPAVVERSTPADEGSSKRLAGWITLGGAGVALGAGVVLNLLARAKMDDCNTFAMNGDKT